MYQALANVTTADAYADAATLRLPGAVRIVLQVANAAVFYQLDESDEGKGLWTGERFLAPSIGSLDRRSSGIRFRSAVAGAPAQVSCELADEAELTGASDSLGAFTQEISPAGAVTPSSSVIDIVTSLPTSPADGREVLLQDSHNRLWHMKFTVGGTGWRLISNGATVRRKTSASTYSITATAITALDTTSLRLPPTIHADLVNLVDVELVAHLPRVAGPGGANRLRIAFMEAGSRIGSNTLLLGAEEGGLMIVTRVPTPAAGAHTYDLAAWVGGGTGTIDGADTGPIEIQARVVPATV